MDRSIQRRLSAIGRMKTKTSGSAPMTAIAKQLISDGPRSERMAVAVLDGVVTGLAIEQAAMERHPICPNCGRRHP